MIIPAISSGMRGSMAGIRFLPIYFVDILHELAPMSFAAAI